MHRLLLMLLVLLPSFGLAQTAHPSELLKALEKEGMIGRWSAKPPRALAEWQAERSYSVDFLGQNGRVTGLEVSLLVPKGARHVGAVSVIYAPPLPERDNHDPAWYAVGYMLGFFQAACLEIQMKSEITDWLGSVIEGFQRQGGGKYQKRFGALSLAVTADYGLERVMGLGILAQRTDHPGPGWKRTCALQ